MTPEQLTRLRRLAEAATPGPWQHYRDKLRPQFSTRVNEVQADRERAVVAWSGFDDSARPEKQHAANAAYIAAVSPDVTLALLDTIAAQVTQIERLTGELDEMDRAPLSCDEPGCERNVSAGTPRIYGLAGGEYRRTCHDHVPVGWPEGRALSDGTIIRPFRSGPESALQTPEVTR
jgi:hypothetical protein